MVSHRTWRPPRTALNLWLRHTKSTTPAPYLGPAHRQVSDQTDVAGHLKGSISRNLLCAQQVDAINRYGWTSSIGIGGRHQPVRCPESAGGRKPGISGRLGPDAGERAGRSLTTSKGEPKRDMGSWWAFLASRVKVQVSQWRLTRPSIALDVACAGDKAQVWARCWRRALRCKCLTHGKHWLTVSHDLRNRRLPIRPAGGCSNC